MYIYCCVIGQDPRRVSDVLLLCFGIFSAKDFLEEGGNVVPFT